MMISENFDMNEENSISLNTNNNYISINKSSNKIKFIFKIILLIICIFILSKNVNKKNNNITENKNNDNFQFNNETNNINDTKFNRTDNSNDMKFNETDNKVNYNYTYNFDKNISSIRPLAIYHSSTLPISKKEEILKDKKILETINNQINYAKNNNIYGFGIYYDWNINNEMFNDPLDIIWENKNISFPYLLIFRNENKIINNTNLVINLVKYFKDPRYIRIKNKPGIGIYNPDGMSNLEKNIISFRSKLGELGIGEIFILASCNELNIDRLIKYNIFDGFYDLTFLKSMKPAQHSGTTYYFYFYTLYKNQYLNSYYNNKKSIIYRSSDIITQYPLKTNMIKTSIYFDYSPYKFNYLNEMIIDWTKKKYEDNRYIFINSYDNSYLDPDQKTGKESLNYLYKLLTKNQNEVNKYNFTNLQNNCLIAVQAHIYYIDLIDKIISLTNNIPAKFDLYITTTSESNKNSMEEYVKNKTKANKYEILIVENKGRDVLPLLTQLKNVIHKYKYFCHIHTKKSNDEWRDYLYKNLLGKNIISDILYEFENSEKLGLIFPPVYSQIIQCCVTEKLININHMKEIFKRISQNIKVTNKYDFPAGNMFWARSEAVHQLITFDLAPLCPNEPVKIDGTILHGMERAWKFMAEFNGYTYKQIFKYL